MRLGRLRALLLSTFVGLVAPSVVAEPKAPKSAAAKARPRARVQPKKQATPKRTSSKPKRASKPQRAAHRGNRYLETLPPGEAEQSPAYAYANLTNAEAYAELDRRRVPYRRESPAPDGVRAPIRLTGPLHGVTVRSSLPEAERRTTRFEVLDARLAIALHDFSEVLAAHDVVELVHYTMYRPGSSPLADTDSLPTRHPGGLAIDVGALRKRDGTWLHVERVWQADVGAKTCGTGAKQQKNALASELVGLVCEVSARRLFHYVLTPHYDRAHRDHLHLEIKPAVKWFLVN